MIIQLLVKSKRITIRSDSDLNDNSSMDEVLISIKKVIFYRARCREFSEANHILTDSILITWCLQDVESSLKPTLFWQILFLLLVAYRTKLKFYKCDNSHLNQVWMSKYQILFKSGTHLEGHSIWDHRMVFHSQSESSQLD